MNRTYLLESALERVRDFSLRFPRGGLGTDIIAGFPGETRAEFDEGAVLFEELPFTYAHVFPYSERKDTAATRLDGYIEPGERRRRSARLRAIAERKRRAHFLSLVDSVIEVIAERRDGGSVLGTSGEYAFARVMFSNHSGLSGNEDDSLEEVIGKRLRVVVRGYDESEGKIICDALNPD
jgi:threonylcarbamoyladenosine tRNA methylthiotransferase MtaB